MIGTLLNVTGIVAGGLIGLARPKPLAPATDTLFKVWLGAFAVFYGLRLSWLSFNGSFLQILKQLLIVMVAMMLGKMTGHLLRFQAFSNRLGHAAREGIARANPADPQRLNDGFMACTALFCAAPLGVLGAVQDGLSDYFFPLAIKGVIEGLATFGFVSLFGWSAILAALPVLAFQGSITLVCLHAVRPFLLAQGLVDSVNATGGLLVFSVALVILGLKKSNSPITCRAS